MQAFKGRSAKIAAVVVAVLALAALAAALGAFALMQGSHGVKLSPNLVTYDENSSDYTILACDDASVTVSDASAFKEGSILAASVTEATPNGLLRRVASIEQGPEGAVLHTEQAALTDAIERCDESFTATVLPDGTYQVVSARDAGNPLVQQAFADVDGAFVDFENDWLSVQAGNSIDVSIKVESGAIEMSVVDHVQAEAALRGAGLKDGDDVDIFSKPLKPCVVWVGSLPVVFVNEFSLGADYEAAISLMAFEGRATLDKRMGFGYSTADGLSAVNEDLSEAPALSFSNEDDIFSATLDATVQGTLSSKLYGVAGAAVSTGLGAQLESELQVVPEGEDASGAFALPGIDAGLRGSLTGKIYVPLSGEFVLDVPSNPFDGTRDPDELSATIFDAADALVLRERTEQFGSVSTPATRAADLYFQAVSTAPAYFDPALQASGYSYALVNMTGGAIPELLLRADAAMGNGVSAVRVLSYDADAGALVEYEGELTEGVAGAGGYRGVLAASDFGDGLLATEWSSGTGDGETYRVRIAAGALERSLVRSFSQLGSGAVSDAAARESKEISWLAASDASAIDALRAGAWQSTATNPGGRLADAASAAGLTLCSGTLHVVDVAGLCALQGVDNPNPDAPDAKTYAVLVFDAPISLNAQSGDGSGMRAGEAKLLLLSDEGTAYRGVDGMRVTAAADPSSMRWPSDTSLPLGEPRTTDALLVAG